MGQFTSLCVKCDSEIHWFLFARDGIVCRNCGYHNDEKEIHDSLIGSPFREKKELMIKNRRKTRDRKLKIDEIKKSL